MRARASFTVCPLRAQAPISSTFGPIFMKFSDHIFYLFSLRRSVDELTTPRGGGGRGVGSKNLNNDWSKSFFFLENKVVIDFDFRSGTKKSGHLDYPLQSYGPKVITHPKKRRPKKITRLQFCVPSFHIESAWSH